MCSCVRQYENGLPNYLLECVPVACVYEIVKGGIVTAAGSRLQLRDGCVDLQESSARWGFPFSRSSLKQHQAIKDAR